MYLEKSNKRKGGAYIGIYDFSKRENLQERLFGKSQVSKA